MIQNFADGHLPTVGGAIVVPTSDGVYAFVDAGDIAAIAVETQARPSSPKRSVGGSSGAVTRLETTRSGHFRRVNGTVTLRPQVGH